MKDWMKRAILMIFVMVVSVIITPSLSDAAKAKKTSVGTIQRKAINYIGMTYDKIKKKYPKIETEFECDSRYYASVPGNKIFLCFVGKDWKMRNSDKVFKVSGKLSGMVSGVKKTVTVKKLAKQLKPPKGSL